MKQKEFDKLLVEADNKRALPEYIEKRAQGICAKLQMKAYRGRWNGSDRKRWEFANRVIEEMRERKRT